MKNIIIFLIKNKLIIFLCTIILVLAFNLFQKDNNPKILTSSNTFNGEEYKDKENNNRTIVLVNRTEQDLLNKQLKEYKKSMKDKDAKIKSLTVLVNAIDTTIKSDSSTSGNFFIKKEDENISIIVEKDSNESQASIKLLIQDSLYLAYYTTNRWLRLERMKYKLDIKHTNKLISTKTGKSYEIKEGIPIISFGIQTGYNPFTNSIYYGAGLQLNILSIKINRK